MNEIPTPITRKEQYLAKAAGDSSVNVPDPITREEQYLNAIAQGGGGGGSSLPPVTAEDNGDVLTVVDGEWGKGDPPYTVGESMSTVFAEQTVTTSAYQGTNVAQIPGSFDISVGISYKVTYNGTAYDVTAQEMSGNVYLGEFSGQPDYTNYPFFILVAQAEGMIVYSSTANPTLKIEVGTKTVVPSDDFKAAVAASGVGLLVNMIWDNDESQYTLNKNYQEIATALQNGIMPIFNDNDIGSAVYTLYYLVSCGYEDDVQMYGVTIVDITNPTDPITFYASTTTGELVSTQ